MKSFTRTTLSFLVFAIVPISYVHAQDIDAHGIPSEDSEEIVIEEVEKKENATPEDVDIIVEDENIDNKDSNNKDEEDGVSEGKVLDMDKAKSLIKDLPTAPDAVTGTVPKSSVLKYYDIYGRTLAFRESAKDLRASLDKRRDIFEKPRTETIESYRNSKEKIYAAEMAAFDKGQNIGINDTKVNDTEVSGEDHVLTKDMSVNEEEVGVIEKDIPSDDKTVKKTVVTSEDAPDFDASKL